MRQLHSKQALWLLETNIQPEKGEKGEEKEEEEKVGEEENKVEEEEETFYSNCQNKVHEDKIRVQNFFKLTWNPYNW